MGHEHLRTGLVFVTAKADVPRHHRFLMCSTSTPQTSSDAHHLMLGHCFHEARILAALLFAEHGLHARFRRMVDAVRVDFTPRCCV